MSFAASRTFTTGPNQIREGLRGLRLLAQTKGSLWSCDLFRRESATLRTHWVLVLMVQFTRRIIGLAFTAPRGYRGAVPPCSSERFVGTAAKYLSSDHDPLYRFLRCQANLRVLEVAEIKTIR